MLDIKFIRENKELIALASKKKKIDFDIDKLILADDKRKNLLLKVEEKRADQKVANNKIVTSTSEEREVILEQMKILKTDLEKDEGELKEIMKEWHALMLQVPNIPDISVPEGESDEDNQEYKKWGDIPSFSFKPKAHYEIMTDLGLADFERGAKVSGFRGYFLKNDGVRLVWALERFVEDMFLKKGFNPMIVPSMLRRESFIGTGYLPQSEEDLYKTQDGDYLAGTAEVSTMGYYMDEVLEKKMLPLKFFSYSQCFRREAGSHGKDEKGVFRIHEFFKYEQVVLCEANHDESVRIHEELTKNSEEILEALKLPYRVVVNCGADLGLGQVKKYDIETWMPSENRYRETHSSSYFHDFQTRRLNIRYRDEDGKLRYVHSLNNTALAMPRILCQLLENYQNPDGSVRVPDVLIPYMNGEDMIRKK